MKRLGSTFEYEKERNEDLLNAFNKELERCDYINVKEVCRRVAKSPSKRFWVSESRAVIVIAKMLKGDRLRNMRPMKKAMFMEIFRRVKLCMAEYSNWSLRRCVSKVIMSPAPEFYITPLSLQIIICKIKRKKALELRKRLGL